VLRAELKKPSVRSVASAAPSFEQAERQAIIDAWVAASGRIAGKGGAAERLRLKRTTLQNKMNKLNISRAEYSGLRIRPLWKPYPASYLQSGH